MSTRQEKAAKKYEEKLIKKFQRLEKDVARLLSQHEENVANLPLISNPERFKVRWSEKVPRRTVLWPLEGATLPAAYNLLNINPELGNVLLANELYLVWDETVKIEEEAERRRRFGAILLIASSRARSKQDDHFYDITQLVYHYEANQILSQIDLPIVSLPDVYVAELDYTPLDNRFPQCEECNYSSSKETLGITYDEKRLARQAQIDWVRKKLELLKRDKTQLKKNTSQSTEANDKSKATDQSTSANTDNASRNERRVRDREEIQGLKCQVAELRFELNARVQEEWQNRQNLVKEFNQQLEKKDGYIRRLRSKLKVFWEEKEKTGKEVTVKEEKENPQDHSCSCKDVVVAVPSLDAEELEKENQALHQKNMSYREELRLLRSHLASSQQRESNMYDSREAMENELIEAKEGAAKEIARLRAENNKQKFALRTLSGTLVGLSQQMKDQMETIETSLVESNTK